MFWTLPFAFRLVCSGHLRFTLKLKIRSGHFRFSVLLLFWTLPQLFVLDTATLHPKRIVLDTKRIALDTYSRQRLFGSLFWTPEQAMLAGCSGHPHADISSKVCSGHSRRHLLPCAHTKATPHSAPPHLTPDGVVAAKGKCRFIVGHIPDMRCTIYVI